MVIWCHSVLILKIISIRKTQIGHYYFEWDFFSLCGLHLGAIMALLNERAGILVGGGKNSKEKYLKGKY